MAELQSPHAAEAGAQGARRRGRRTSGGFKQPPWRALRNLYSPVEVIDAEGLERIHDTSMRVLETQGLEFLSPRALDILAKAGAEVDRSTGRVRFDRGLIEQCLASAPSSFTLHARNPEHDVTIGGDHLAFCAVSSAPNCSDLDGGRRPGTFADYGNFLRLMQSLNIIHLAAGYPVEPADLPPPT
ncbi:MAG TPA: trimethylamine methyltransferase family protein, partial [Dongiaceae bacterium]